MIKHPTRIDDLIERHLKERAQNRDLDRVRAVQREAEMALASSSNSPAEDFSEGLGL
jgi:hypothetical protein